MKNNLQLPSDLPEGFQYTPPEGLTEEEAVSRAAAGESNRPPEADEKSTAQILRGHLLTLFNLLNFALAGCLIAVGSFRNMLFLGVVISNILIGTIQEVRARRTIRQLKLLNTSPVRVIRGGHETSVQPEKLVRGDLIVLRGGEQVCADAVVTGGFGAAVEALLTGESDPVMKETGSWLYSGSYIAEGRLTAQLVYVGADSYAGRLTREARKTKRPESVLMKELRKLIRIVSAMLVPLGALLFVKQVWLNHLTVSAAIPPTVGAMLGMIPEGLMLLTSVAMAAGVVKLGRKGALVQELATIETLARADVLCLDKTGTLTSGRMRMETMEALEATEEEARASLSRFMGGFDDSSSTLDAIRAAVTSGLERPIRIMPFSSRRKKSAAEFADGTTLILGAPAFVAGDLIPEAVRRRIGEMTDDGSRVLLLAEHRDPGAASGDSAGDAREKTGAQDDASAGKQPETGSAAKRLERDVQPTRLLALIALRDELRKGVRETLAYFREQDVELRILSGDDPRTVSRIARDAGLPGWDRWMDASEAGGDGKLADCCETCTVFGRVRPEQKKEIVEALRARGHSVAMTGDGVNDIPAMKAADCSIAMMGGSDAARNAAQLTLLNSDFSVMPAIVLEGRRVINNITRTATLFLTKTIFSVLLSLLVLFVPGRYPFQPIQLTLMSSLLIGLPGFFLALEPSGERIRGDFLKTVLIRALPGGMAVALCAALAMSLSVFGWDHDVCSTIATFAAAAAEYAILVRICMPLNWRRVLMLAGIAAAFAGAVRFLNRVFFLTRLGGAEWAATGALIAIGFILIAVIGMLIAKKESLSSELVFDILKRGRREWKKPGKNDRTKNR